MENEESTALEVIAEGIGNLPAPVETSLFKALSHLLGGVVAIPAAWLKRPSQAVDDVTTARSAVSAILAKAVAETALKDPAVMQAAAETYLPGTIRRKARNTVRVGLLAAQRTAEQAGSQNSDKSAAPDEDWMNSFIRFAEDASSERLQDLFARILAGQVVRPGSFSVATLRALSELDKSTAEDFTKVWGRSVGDSVDYEDDFRRGEWFSRWRRLAEAGLMAPTDIIQYLPPFVPQLNGNAIWSPMSGGTVHLMVHFSQSCKVNWPHIEFTRVGRQIGSILAEPDYRANIHKVAQKFVGKGGVERIEVLEVGRPVERIA